MGAIGGEELSQWEKMAQVGSDERIRVSVRLRPLNVKETVRNDTSDWECINDNTIIFRNSGPERSMFPTAYTFDRVFRYDCSTKQVYEEGAKEVALSVVSGINSSVFAYGQTSSGKTYTMTGVTECTVADIYDYIQKHEEREFVLKFSAMEIYNEAVRDLLSADGSQLRLLDDPERGTVVEKLTEETLTDESHLRELLSICEAQRQIGETSLNENSSRSHQILRLTIESSVREFSGKENSSTLAASVNFVDLAGSERASQTLSAGARLKEGCHINRSLLTLGTVIRKLSKGRNGHVPYRDSKLTRILQNSLGGNARTAIICTMSPARIHVEQSRNTLLFASCAKAVSTSAQVNVVMSEKALVKHLQKELARLEGELRYPIPTSDPFHSEALLREKDVQILKLEKEIKELIQQRDIAQSRLEDLVQAVGDGQASSHEMNACEDEFKLIEASDKNLAFGISAFNTSQYYKEYSDSSDNDQYLQHSEKPKDCILYGGTSPRLSISSSMSGELVPNQGRDKISQVNSEDFEDLCKEVRCIEVEESSARRNEESDALFPEENNGLLDLTVNGSERAGDQELGVPPKGGLRHNTDFTYGALEKKLQNVQKTVDYLIRPYPDELSPLPLTADLSSSKTFGLTRSRSCRATLMTSSSSPWFPKAEQNENTPPSWFEKDLPGKPGGFQTPLKEDFQTCDQSASVDVIQAQSIKSASTENMISMSNFDAGLKEMEKPQYQKQIVDRQESEQDENTPPTWFEKDFPGRPGGFQRTLSVLNYGVEIQMLSREASQTSERSSSVDVLEAVSINNAAEESMSSICSFVSGMKEMAKLQYQKQLADGQEPELKTNEEVGTEKILKDVGQDPMPNPLESPSRWSLEFERQRREIIEFWHACNVSLAHRTYFFLLFKGDPTDSIYMEVELRRLSFLKKTFSQRNVDKRSIEGDRIATLASSARALRREREMLSKQMQKRLTVNERESLYQKWGIGLDTKQRRLQLARLLWTETNDMDHVRESATIVAKLVGFLEPGQALKEMFGLSFTPQRIGRRSFSWKHQ